MSQSVFVAACWQFPAALPVSVITATLFVKLLTLHLRFSTAEHLADTCPQEVSLLWDCWVPSVNKVLTSNQHLSCCYCLPWKLPKVPTANS